MVFFSSFLSVCLMLKLFFIHSKLIFEYKIQGEMHFSLMERVNCIKKLKTYIMRLNVVMYQKE